MIIWPRGAHGREMHTQANCAVRPLTPEVRHENNDGQAHTRGGRERENYEPTGAVVPATEVRVMRSVSAERDYLISVARPYHYDEEPEKVWPVIYVLDGNLYFGMVVDMVRAMNIRVEGCNELPDAFVVGVGYPVEGSLSNMLHEVMHRRMRDFLPDRDGDAEQFIQEAFPVIRPALAGGSGIVLAVPPSGAGSADRVRVPGRLR